METSLEMRIGSILTQRRLTLATAESCTGGLISDQITNVAGSSVYFLGGIIAYSYEAKAALLNVSWDTLNARGAVSHETVLEMARGARSALNAHIAVSVSGIAGPGGGTEEKPVGTTWLGLVTPEGEWTRRFVWNGGRRQNKRYSSEAALQFILDYLEGKLK
ncbi:MAG: competence protein ComA [Chloroflexi bacterium]|nr:competence protein ComA [Chloroflexota bacterium]MDL1943383.1 CinA family protein [Chloroflexi bacterium CFX2]